MVRRRRTFTPEFKAQVVLEVLTGAATMAQACQKYRLKQPVVSRWKAEFLERAPRVFGSDSTREVEEERIAELERMVGRLTMQLEVAKKASSMLASPSARNGK